MEGRSGMFNLVDREGKNKLHFSDLKRISEKLDYNFEDAELTEIIHNVAGPKEKNSITYEQFENYIAKKLSEAKIKNDKLKK